MELSSNHGFGLREHLATWFRHRSTILRVTGSAIVVAIALSFLMDKTYVTQTRVLVQIQREPLRLSSSLTTPGSAPILAPEDHVRTEVQLLLSPEVARQLAEQIGPERVRESMRRRWDWLKNLPGRSRAAFKRTLLDWGPSNALLKALGVKPDGPKDPLVAATSSLRKAIGAEPITKTDMFLVTFRAPDAEFAAYSLNELIRVYLDHHLALRQPQWPQGLLAEEAKRFSERVAEAEERLQTFKNTWNIVSLESQRELLLERMGGMESALAEAQRAVVASQERIRQLNSQMANRDDAVYQELQKVVALEMGNKGAQEGRGEKLALQIQELTRRVTELDRKEVDLRALALDVRVRRHALELFLTQQEEARVGQAFSRRKISNVSQVEPARVPIFPRSPRKTTNALIGLVLGAFGGLGLAYFAEFSRTTMTTREEAERALEKPVLVSIPLREDTTRWVAGDQLEFRRLGELLARRETSERPLSVAVTSSLPGEGRTHVSSELARALAHQGANVLLLSIRRGGEDAEEVAPSARRSLPNSEGLETADVDASRLSRDPVGALRAFRDGRDWIVVDSIDISTWPEQLTLAAHVNEVLFVVEAGATSSLVARESLAALNYYDANVFGLILNKRQFVIPQRVYDWLQARPKRSESA